MPIAADYPFLDIVGTMLIFCAWVTWFWMLVVALGDVFNRQDCGGGKKAVWTVTMLVLPFAGVIAYLITNGDGMAKRRVKEVESQRQQVDEYIRSVAGNGGSTGEIAKAKNLLDSGAITQQEFDVIKSRTLASV